MVDFRQAPRDGDDIARPPPHRPETPAPAPRKVSSLVRRPCLHDGNRRRAAPSPAMLTLGPRALLDPAGQARRPRKLSYSRMLATMANGAFAIRPSAGGTWLTTQVEQSVQVSPRGPSSVASAPTRAGPTHTASGNRAGCPTHPEAAKQVKTPRCAPRPAEPSWRSILFTTHDRMNAARPEGLVPTTNLCLRQHAPQPRSTSHDGGPSTIIQDPASTSPPKSAWPGVSDDVDAHAPSKARRCIWPGW